MAIDIAIPATLAKAFAALRDLDDTQADKLVAELRGATLARVEDLQRVVARVADEEKASELSMALLNLVHLKRAHLAAPADLHSAIRTALARRTGPQRWSADDLAKWDAVGARLNALLTLDSLLVLEKVLDLKFDHESILQRARLITEMQPVFSEDLSDIRSFLVAHTLRVDYTRANRAESLSLALDEQDLVLLKKECERALQKARLVRDRMKALNLEVADPDAAEKG